MSIKYVKVKRKINVGSNPGEKFLARLVRGEDVRIDTIATEISEATTVSYPDVLACLKALEMEISKYVMAGQAVKFEHLGSFIPAISAEAQATVDTVSSDTIRRASCRFVPSVAFKNRLAKCTFELADFEVKGIQ